MLVSETAFMQQMISHMAPSIIDKTQLLSKQNSPSMKDESKEIWMDKRELRDYFPHIGMSLKAFTMQTERNTLSCFCSLMLHSQNNQLQEGI